MSWNLRKADWKSFKNLSTAQINDQLIEKNNDKTEKNIRNAIIGCAKKSIPRGKNSYYKPFWNQTKNLKS